MAQERIMLVDDSAICLDILAEMLKDQYDILRAESGRQALALMRDTAHKPGLVLLDVYMPDMDGYQVHNEMKNDPTLRDIPVMYITVDNNEFKGLMTGAVDFITKPFDPEAVALRVANQIELRRYRQRMESLVDDKAHELIATKEMVLETLANMVEYRSHESGTHIKRTKTLTEILVAKLTRDKKYQMMLKSRNPAVIIKAAALHDIGKIGIPDNILLKPGRLTPEEFDVIKTHTLIGSEIFKPMMLSSGDEYFTYCYEISRSHHEHWDGDGYPDGLIKEDIPLSARILALVDVYDALVSKRCYKEAYPHEQAIAIIARGTGNQFDPEIVSAFLEAQDQIKNAMTLL